jgi:hypothetical protein
MDVVHNRKSFDSTEVAQPMLEQFRASNEQAHNMSSMKVTSDRIQDLGRENEQTSSFHGLQWTLPMQH